MTVTQHVTVPEDYVIAAIDWAVVTTSSSGLRDAQPVMQHLAAITSTMSSKGRARVRLALRAGIKWLQERQCHGAAAWVDVLYACRDSEEGMNA